jgi:hypothetical protein
MQQIPPLLSDMCRGYEVQQWDNGPGGITVGRSSFGPVDNLRRRGRSPEKVKVVKMMNLFLPLSQKDSEEYRILERDCL